MAYLIGLKNRPPIPKSEGQKQSESADYNRQLVDPCKYLKCYISKNVPIFWQSWSEKVGCSIEISPWFQNILGFHLHMKQKIKSNLVHNLQLNLDIWLSICSFHVIYQVFVLCIRSSFHKVDKLSKKLMDLYIEYLSLCIL